MSAMKQMEKLILTETKGLPPNAINEVLDFIQFIKKFLVCFDLEFLI